MKTKSPYNNQPIIAGHQLAERPQRSVCVELSEALKNSCPNKSSNVDSAISTVSDILTNSSIGSHSYQCETGELARVSQALGETVKPNIFYTARNQRSYIWLTDKTRGT